jgi:cysteine desulfurase
MVKKIIYMDNAATTQVDSAVAKKVNEFMLNNYGNASSVHQMGKKAREAVENAREKIAKFIGAKPSEIIFTSGGSESNNLAIKGLALANPAKKHIITSVIEHPSVLEVCKSLEKQGYSVDYVGVDSDGIVDVKEIEKKIKKDTLLVSVMHVNNEIGTIQPVKKIGEICKKKGVYFHSDCVQSFAKLDIDVGAMNLDMISVSGHKINAPKGVGFLYVRGGIRLKGLIDGGGQEKGIRSGTENVPGIVGLGIALDVVRDKKGILNMRNKLIKDLMKIEGAQLNGSLKERIWNNVNVSFYGIEGESLMLMLDRDEIIVSTGSACSSHKLAESYVLGAIGVEDLYLHGSLRMTLGKISAGEVDFVVGSIKKAVEKLREISPFKFKSDNGAKK